MFDHTLRWFTWPTAAWGRPLANKAYVSDVFAFHAATGGNVDVFDCRREKQPSVRGVDETHRCGFTASSEVLSLIGAEPTSGTIVVGFDEGLIEWFDVTYFDGPPLTWAFDNWMFQYADPQTLAAWATGGSTSIGTTSMDGSTQDIFVGGSPESLEAIGVGHGVFGSMGRPTYSATTGKLLLELARRYASEAAPQLEGIDVVLRVESCLEGWMEGTVTNQSSRTIEVAVVARFSDGEGVEERVLTVARLSTGETTRWGAADLGQLVLQCEDPKVAIALAEST